jgi:RNA polymerase sigma-70 factor (ECF subfamily)
MPACASRRSGGGRGADRRRVPLDSVLVASEDRVDDVVAIDEALERLAVQDARKAQVVEYRFFGGLNVRETAAVLNVSPETVKRDWQFARTWLMHELSTET